MMKPNLSIVLCSFFCFLLFSSCTSYQASPPPLPNPRLLSAYGALQAWKAAMVSDPMNFTSNWIGLDVCAYNGIYCATAPDDPIQNITTVAGIDLNQADIVGTLPESLGLLRDIAFFHLNSNRFSGTIPETFRNLGRLSELDVSNNQFTGGFPKVVLNLPSLIFLDLRFNQFQGDVPMELFDLKLDAIFLNNNNFRFRLPDNIGNSPVSVLVLANNEVNGCLPSGLARMADTLHEIILLNNAITGCLPLGIGLLKQVTVFDVSFNKLVGSLPETIGNMVNLEQLNIASNDLSGDIPASICALPNLQNFTFSDNYFTGEPQSCSDLPNRDDSVNCISGRPMQRPYLECVLRNSLPVSCEAFGCTAANTPATTPIPIPPIQVPIPPIRIPIPPIQVSTPPLLPPIH